MIGDSPEHLMNPSSQYFFIHLTQCSVVPNLHFGKQLDLLHPAKRPKQLAQLVDSSVFSIIHFSVHSAAPQQPVPQLSRTLVTSFCLRYHISSSSWLHCPAPWIIPVSPELNDTLFYRKERRYLWYGINIFRARGHKSHYQKYCQDMIFPNILMRNDAPNLI